MKKGHLALAQAGALFFWINLNGLLLSTPVLCTFLLASAKDDICFDVFSNALLDFPQAGTTFRN
jgi:hypothetical protein